MQQYSITSQLKNVVKGFESDINMNEKLQIDVIKLKVIPNDTFFNDTISV